MPIKSIEGERKPAPYGRLALAGLIIIAALIFTKTIKPSEKQIESSILSAQSTAVPDKPQNKSTAVNNTLDQIANVTDNISDLPGAVLGVATDTISTVASGSVQMAEDFLFENTILNLFKQYERLSERQKEQVKEFICK